MTFGSYFKDLRNSKQVTQKQIADAIKKKPMLVSNVENDKNGSFSYGDLKKISIVLSLSDEEKRKLYKEAAKSREKLPKDLQEYIIKLDEACSLLEMLVQK